MKIKKMIILLGIVCTWNILLAGCGTTHEYVTDKQEKQVLSEEPKDALSEENAADTKARFGRLQRIRFILRRLK